MITTAGITPRLAHATRHESISRGLFFFVPCIVLPRSQCFRGKAWGRRTSPSRKTQASMSRLHVSSGGPRKVSDQRSVSCSWRGRGVSIGSGPASGQGGVRVWTWVKGQQSSRVGSSADTPRRQTIGTRTGQCRAALRCAALQVGRSKGNYCKALQNQTDSST
jgi:hypothetical protein